MKPVLDSMTNKVVMSLSGDAREFYDREFSFFNEVTSISGKLKPFIKKTKPEKKVCMNTSALPNADLALGQDRRRDGKNYRGCRRLSSE